jgi:hypothetical protein
MNITASFFEINPYANPMLSGTTDSTNRWSTNFIVCFVRPLIANHDKSKNLINYLRIRLGRGINFVARGHLQFCMFLTAYGLYCIFVFANICLIHFWRISERLADLSVDLPPPLSCSVHTVLQWHTPIKTTIMVSFIDNVKKNPSSRDNTQQIPNQGAYSMRFFLSQTKF